MHQVFDIEKEELEKYFAMHMTYEQIAEKYGCSKWTVMKKARSFGMRSEGRKYQMIKDNPARREEVQRKISETVSGMWADGHYENRENGMTGRIGEAHPNFKGETVTSLYREKAKHFHPEAICLCCGKKLNWDDKSLEVHHVDGDHQNLLLSNLMPLCHSCHKKYHRKNQPTVKITKLFKFDACHYLPYHDGKCKYLHGHTYHMEITVENKVLNETGMVMDFGELKRIVNEKVVDLLDHSFFNDLIEYPTCELMVSWIWNQLSKDVKGLYKIKLYETDGSFCELDKHNALDFLKNFEAGWRGEAK